MGTCSSNPQDKYKKQTEKGSKTENNPNDGQVKTLPDLSSQIKEQGLIQENKKNPILVKNPQIPPKDPTLVKNPQIPPKDHIPVKNPQIPPKDPTFNSVQQFQQDAIVISTQDTVHERKGKKMAFSKDYSIIKQIGSGGFGQVFLAQHNITLQLRAIKIVKFNRNKQNHSSLFKELEVLRGLDHPHIVKVFDLYEDGFNLYLVLEHCSGGELLQKIHKKKKFEELEVAQVLEQVLSAIHFLHINKISHRDIKPENILFATANGSTIKLIDFGISQKVDDSEGHTDKCGTLLYMAPEAIKGYPTLKSDIWSCGILMYYLFTGHHPFKGKNAKDIQKNIEKSVAEYGQEIEDLPQQVRRLIHKMLSPNAKNRPSALKILCSDWLQTSLEQVRKQDKKPIGTNTVLVNMKKFKSTEKLQQMLLMFIVNILSTNEQKDNLIKVFEELDSSHDGKLSKIELFDGFIKMNMDKISAQESVDKIFDQINENKNGEIDYSEFLMASIDKNQLLHKTNLNRAFNMLDRDKSGTISIKEFKYHLNGQSIPDEVWKQLIHQLDTNGDDKISKQEFFASMLKLVDST